MIDWQPARLAGCISGFFTRPKRIGPPRGGTVRWRPPNGESGQPAELGA